MTDWRVVDLFSGLGGFALGLEAAGMKTAAFCEIDPKCRQVLAAHWPKVKQYDDICDLDAEHLRRDSIFSNALCGGFPCQDASLGKVSWGERTGTDGARTGLYRHIIRLAADLRPGFLLLENVPGLLSAGFGHVLGDLAALGLDAEWRCLPASKAGLPHRRDRLWVIAYPRGSGLSRPVGGQSLLERAEATLAQHGDAASRAWRSLDERLVGLRGRDGVSVGMERRRIGPLGNAVAPPVVQAIGAAIIGASE